MKKQLAAILAFAAILMSCCAASATEHLLLYTSVKESLINELKKSFLILHPEIELDVMVGGTGQLIKEVEMQRRHGAIAADVLWHSEMADFFQLAREGLLMRYRSPNAWFLDLRPGKKTSDLFAAPRNVTMGIVYNTNLVQTIPKTWEDCASPQFRNSFLLADPTISGTSYGASVAITQYFGWKLLEDMHRNGAIVDGGSSQVVEKVANGEVKACIGVDYIAMNWIKRGAPLAIVYPPEMIVLPSPVAIFAGTEHLEAAEKFVDFLFSDQGQQVIADNYSLPARMGFPAPPDSPLPNAYTAMTNAICLDFASLNSTKVSFLKKFFDLMVPSR